VLAHERGEKPESRVPGENRDPVFKMVPDFRRDGVSMPDQVRQDGKRLFMDRPYLITRLLR